MQVGQGGCVADSCAWHRAVVLQKVLDEVRVFILVHLQSFFSLLFMSTLRQTAVAIEELLEGWNLATRFLQNMVPQDPSHTIDELLVAANDVFLKVFSIFASSRIRLEGILIMRWAKMQQCWNDANAKDVTYHDITDPKLHVF